MSPDHGTPPGGDPRSPRCPTRSSSAAPPSRADTFFTELGQEDSPAAVHDVAGCDRSLGGPDWDRDLKSYRRDGAAWLELDSQAWDASPSLPGWSRLLLGTGLTVALLLCVGMLSRSFLAGPRAHADLRPVEVAASPPVLPGAPRAIPIRDVQLGYRVLSSETSEQPNGTSEPDEATWRRVSLVLPRDSGGDLTIDLLRPADWIDEQQIRAGELAFVDLFEMGIEGEAEVTSVGPCPPISPGRGAVVTGKFTHQAPPGTRLVVLSLEGQGEPTRVTEQHPYWSEDRQQFVPVGELRIGEQVDTNEGTSRVLSLTTTEFAGALYNLETTDHVYRVGSIGTLVHNTCGIFRKFDGQIHHIATDKGKFADEFQTLFRRAGLDMQTPWNRMRLQGHVGPHGTVYHKFVYKRLSEAVGGVTGDAARVALINELKAIRREIRYNGLDALLKAVASRVDVRGEF